MAITRREFLKFTAGAVTLAAVPAFDERALARFLTPPLSDQVGILVDTTKCIGCRQCQAACKAKNNLPPDPALKMPYGMTCPPELSDDAFTIVDFCQIGGEGGQTAVRPIKKQCMHCLSPACASVCPVKAIYKTERGPVVYDAEKCMGCRYCLMACPFNIPKFEWDSGNPRIRKCEMCNDRLEQGLVPACVEACPSGALKFGARKDLIAEAQARIAAEPDKYIPYIYGLTEVGGTSVLYLANVPFGELGLRMDLPHHAIPEYSHVVMEKVPLVAVGIGLLMGVVAVITRRRDKEQEVSEEV